MSNFAGTGEDEAEGEGADVVISAAGDGAGDSETARAENSLMIMNRIVGMKWKRMRDVCRTGGDVNLRRGALTLKSGRLASSVSLCAILLLLGTASAGRAEWPFPTNEGTTWQYTLKREPEGETTTLTRQIVPSRDSKKTEAAVRLEQRWDGAMRSAQVLKSEKGAVLAISQSGANGQVSVLTPPVTIVPAKMEPGNSWNFRGHIAGTELALPLRIIGIDEIEIGAGKLRAWHIRGTQEGAVPTVAEQWFAPGVGWVKETVTQRSPTGQLLARRTLELRALPSTHPAASAPPQTRVFEASVSTSTSGAPMDIISSDALQIVARWRVRRLAGNAKVRAVWIAEDTRGIVPAGYQIDEATAIATPPESVGTFTLSRPSDGWAAGKYRVDFYFRGGLAATARITIAPRAAAAEDFGGEL